MQKMSDTPTTDEDLESKRLCCDCIGDEYLSSMVKSQGKTAVCSYCEETAQAFALEDIADLVEEAFDTHFIRTPTGPDSMQYRLHVDPESYYEWHREGLPVVDVIASSADISTEVAQDLQEILDYRHSDRRSYEMGEEAEFASESYYQENSISDEYWQRQWEEFEHMIKTEARFFSRVGAKFLGEIFNDIDKKVTYTGRSLIVAAGPDQPLSSLYRARVFQSLDTLEKALTQPDVELGSPHHSISKSGRMNAAGISVFYGATNPEIALAEVRPPVGSYVTVAEFDLIRPLRLLDLTAVQEIVVSGSIFDPEYAVSLAKAKFLGSLQSHITRPVMPEDESIEYVSTQAVADFLATEGNVPLDGIIYPSVQAEAEGTNVVLFRKASIVEEHAFPKHSKIKLTAGYFDGEEWVDHIMVTITTVPEVTVKDEVPPVTFELLLQQSSDLIGIPSELLPPTLRIVVESIEVHTIQKIKVISNPNKVHWYESSANDADTF